MIKYVITKPVVVIVGIILVILFGILSLMQMPYQLTPSVTRPTISVSSTWSGASPYEIEREVIERQEAVLKGLDNLVGMESSARNGRGSISLEFKLGTPLSQAMLSVSNKLNEVRGYPSSMDKPIIRATGENTSLVVWMMLKTAEGNTHPIREYKSFFNEKVIQHFERIDGVAEVFFPGGTDRTMDVIIDPYKLANYGLTIQNVIDALSSENINVSAGTMEYGRRAYRVRSISEYKSAEQIAQSVIWSDGQTRVRIADVAQIEEGFEKQSGYMLHNFNEALTVGIRPAPGANILELTNAVEQVYRRMNSELLEKEGIKLEWIYDQRGYINSAINLVQQNILIGSFLATLILYVFLRSFSSTIIIALSIPISIVGTFIVMNALGRSLNIVSMAGISFAVGMLMDSAIVVLENIDRHRRMGKGIFTAAFHGSKEVVGALIASVLTTVAIFIPIIGMEEEAGQLFRDIALAASSAVIFSLLVSILVIPMLSYQILRFFGVHPSYHKRTALEAFGAKLVEIIMSGVRWCTKSRVSRLVTIITATIGSILLSYLLFPKMEYLPTGNQNFITGMINPPPGLSYEERKLIGEKIFALNEDYFVQNGYTTNEKGKMPPIEHLFYLGTDSFMFFGVRGLVEDRAGEMIPQFLKTIASIPGITGVAMQPGIFERGMGQGRAISVDVSGAELDSIIKTAQALQTLIRERFPQGTQVRPRPSLELTYPELNIYPDSEKLKAVGLNPSSFGVALDVLMDGRTIAEFKPEGRETIDLVVKTAQSDLQSPEELYRSSLYTPNGGIVPISSLSTLKMEYGINEIRRFERQRTVTLQVTPPKDLPLEEAMDKIKGEFVNELKAKNLLGENQIRLSGTADQLTKTRLALQGGFIFAVIIIYLLMAALYENFIYPLIIIFAVPLAVAGGLFGLKLVDLLLVRQPLDILTMLGFIILVGTVVNNAILIVYQALGNIREEGMPYYEAVLSSVQTRLRPIYMSTLTSLFGMLPLVVAPGPGSEIYRGLGAVILGGLAFSTVITVFVIPALLLFVIHREKKLVDVEILEQQGGRA